MQNYAPAIYAWQYAKSIPGFSDPNDSFSQEALDAGLNGLEHLNDTPAQLAVELRMEKRLNKVVIAVVTAILLTMSVGTVVMRDAVAREKFPPLSPKGERIVQDKKNFTAICLAKLEEFPSRKNWSLGAPLLTATKKWGLVWRVDFSTPEESADRFVNRIVCWGTEEGALKNIQIAVEQNIPPLRKYQKE